MDTRGVQQVRNFLADKPPFPLERLLDLNIRFSTLEAEFIQAFHKCFLIQNMDEYDFSLPAQFFGTAVELWGMIEIVSKKDDDIKNGYLSVIYPDGVPGEIQDERESFVMIVLTFVAAIV